MYPVTPVSSDAVKLVIGTVRLVEVVGIVKAVTLGGAVSPSVMVTVALRLVETLPAASLAQPYRVLMPGVANV
jgi:hypothetical protein